MFHYVQRHLANLRPLGVVVPRAAAIALVWIGAAGAQTPQEPPLGVRARGKDCLTSGCHSDLAKGRYVHQPVSANECDACHTSKNADQHTFAPASESAASCLSCHDDTAEQLEDESLKHHQPVLDGACLACHSAHAADEPALLTAPLGELCLDCHDAYADALDEHEVLHHPFQEKTCDACHAAHAAPHEDLLLEPYPRAIYGTFEEDRFGLCFQCHEAELVSEETTDEATEFRNGEQNLHFLHVAKESKGRSCRVCHTPHSGSQAGLIRSALPFGTEGWTLRIPFRATQSGGSCGPACHAPKGYDRESPVDWTKPLIWPTKEP